MKNLSALKNEKPFGRKTVTKPKRQPKQSNSAASLPSPKTYRENQIQPEIVQDRRLKSGIRRYDIRQ